MPIFSTPSGIICSVTSFLPAITVFSLVVTDEEFQNVSSKALANLFSSDEESYSSPLKISFADVPKKHLSPIYETLSGIMSSFVFAPAKAYSPIYLTPSPNQIFSNS